MSCDRELFFVKQYRNASEEIINNIHSCMNVMKENSIPVATPIAPSNKLINLENIRVYNFVEGSSYISTNEQLIEVAQIYKKLIYLGLKNKKILDIENYVEGFRKIPNILDAWQTQFVKNNEFQAERAAKTMKVLSNYFCESMLNFPQNLMLFCPIHSDFTERNLLFQGDKIILVCDWQAHNYRLLLEQIYSTIARFCTVQPLEGVLDKNRLVLFLSIIIDENDELKDWFWKTRHWFSVLAASTHLRLMNFRLNMFFVEKRRLDLVDKLLYWAVDYCEWLILNQKPLSQWIEEALISK
ncbi:hypothetical protein F7734_27315 [Scytonema sp. UIC 10036]|uniref:hypothetical protein n=1 Tax=Scytonema sp. UIC 10036 TaxID=2304196 RepID=UPI0012DA43E6|nr:hypothetical protein [Scytonema sp. UIC 10036]MUG95862.1 hypothetical protein [Scytonema sp. UIC 10036]